MNRASAEKTFQVASPDDLVSAETHVRKRLGGRIARLHLIFDKAGLILRGRASSYYVKQLAQHAAMEVVGVPILANEIEVP